MNPEAIARIVVHEAFDLHRRFGPGLLEGAYETLLEIRLLGKGVQVERQKHFNIEFEGIVVRDAYRVDLFVEQCLVLELKAIEKLAPVHFKQVLTYLKVLNLPLGLLINFGAATFREGIHRVANDYYAFDARHGRKGDLTQRHNSSGMTIDLGVLAELCLARKARRESIRTRRYRRPVRANSLCLFYFVPLCQIPCSRYHAPRPHVHAVIRRANGRRSA